MSLGSGLGLLALNRRKSDNGVAYGGVAIVYREALGKLERIKFNNRENFEVMGAAVSIRGHTRKLVLIAAYLPPGYSRAKGVAALSYVEEVLVVVKRRYKDPYVIVGGDFNQWKLEDCLADFVDMKEVEVGNTRGNKAIDRLFTNVSRAVTESETVSPLETEEEEGLLRKSDHRVAFCKLGLQRREAFRWASYTYKHP